MKKVQPRNFKALFYRRSITLRTGEPGTPFFASTTSPGSDASFPVDAYGELQEASWSLIASGFCSKQRATRPLEILDGGTSVSQTQWCLDLSWTKGLAKVDHTCICYLPYEKKVYEVAGDPVDPDGHRNKILIYVFDNVQRTIDLNSLPRLF